ncbi:MAG: molybdopterin-dependent oxidoreductase [Ardenticatenia bacterium]|nr:molybdopterin-dependent oxidoreductase [Ardenticatenia bacterium]
MPSPTARPAVPTTSPSQPATPPPSTPVVRTGEVRVTPNEEFYTVDIGRGIPAIDLESYRLKVTGLVERELSLSFEDLKQLSAGAHMRTLECISNPVGGNLIGNAVWEVVPLREVLEMADPSPSAVEVIARAADGFHTSIPVELAMDPLAYLAISMNGEPVPHEHGYPVRCLWPGRYGMKQPKWLVELELTDMPYLGYWERKGWSNEATIKVNSQIETPENQARIKSGTRVVISGRAFAGRSGVRRVEVGIGDAWYDAELIQAREYPEVVWTLWRYEWDTTGLQGRFVIKARATDGNGVRQEGVGGGLLDDTFPDGTSRIHAIRVLVEA